MKDNKLKKLLHAAINDKDAIKTVQRLLTEPEMSNKRIARLLDYLLEHLDEIDDLDKGAIAAAISSEDLSDAVLRKLFSQLSKIVEGVMALRQVETKPSTYKRNLANFYEISGMDGYFVKAARESISKDLPENELERSLELFLGNRMIYQHPRIDLHTHEEFKNCLDDSYLHLMTAAAIVNLHYYCVSKMRLLAYGEAMKVDLEEKTEYFLKSLPFFTEQQLIVQLYTKAVTAYQSLSIKDYYQYKTALLPNIDKLKSEKLNLLNHLINILNFVKFPEGRINENFSLYKFGVENGYFIEKGCLAGHIFNNIVYVACEMKKLEWADQFIKSHTQYLHAKSEEFENIQRLYTCFIEFAKGNYEDVLVLLASLRFSNHTYGIRKHILVLKCFYESTDAREHYSIESLTDSFKSYLDRKVNDKNNPISQRQKAVQLNFINMLSQLLKIPFDHSLSKEKLIAQLHSYSGIIAEIKWFKEKITCLPLWNYINGFKQDYDNAWSKYDALAKIKKKDSGFKKMLSRYMAKGIIDEKQKKSFLNFYNLLARICDERNPRNARRHLLKKLASYGDFIIEKKWLEEKIRRIRP